MLFGLSLSFVHPLDTRRLDKLRCRFYKKKSCRDFRGMNFTIWFLVLNHSWEAWRGDVEAKSCRPIQWERLHWTDSSFTLNVQMYDRKGCRPMVGSSILVSSHFIDWWTQHCTLRGFAEGMLVFLSQTGWHLCPFSSPIAVGTCKQSSKFSDDWLVLKSFSKHGGRRTRCFWWSSQVTTSWFMWRLWREEPSCSLFVRKPSLDARSDLKMKIDVTSLTLPLPPKTLRWDQTIVQTWQSKANVHWIGQ